MNVMSLSSLIEQSKNSWNALEDHSTSVIQNVGNLDPVTPSHLIPGNL